jgi:hypothetical protein
MTLWIPGFAQVGRRVMTLDQAAERWPDWSLWHSRNGALVCATRRRTLSHDEMYAGLDRTLIENDVASLVRRLTEQDEKERAV